MTNEQIFRSAVINAIARAKAAGDLDKVARLEVAREWVLNPKFRKALTAQQRAIVGL